MKLSRLLVLALLTAASTVGAQRLPTPLRPIAPPSGLAGTATSATVVSLTWTNPEGVAANEVHRALNAAGPWSTVTPPRFGVATQWADTAAPAGSTVHYRVAARSASGASAVSASVSVTTPPLLANRLGPVIAAGPVVTVQGQGSTPMLKPAGPSLTGLTVVRKGAQTWFYWTEPSSPRPTRIVVSRNLSDPNGTYTDIVLEPPPAGLTSNPHVDRGVPYYVKANYRIRAEYADHASAEHGPFTVQPAPEHPSITNAMVGGTVGAVKYTIRVPAGATGFHVYRNFTPITPQPVGLAGMDAPHDYTWEDKPLQPGTYVYTFRTVYGYKPSSTGGVVLNEYDSVGFPSHTAVITACNAHYCPK